MELYERYKVLDDEKVIESIHKGDESALEYMLEKYKGLVKMKSRSFFIVGGDNEDIIQEGMIGLHKALRDFDSKKNVSFCTFAELCITRQIATAIKLSRRKKHIPLNNSVSLNKTLNDETDDAYLDMFSAGEMSNPENLIIDRESVYDIGKSIINNLSRLENRVLILYLKGKTYTDIAAIMNKDEKSIDNALQRVKKKIIKIIHDRNAL